MPSQDAHIEVERGRDSDRDRDRDKDGDQDNDKADRVERSSSKQKPSPSQKTKDLSHVPCKFFKVGACTAGSSCPFSHVVPEPGHKEACAWFVKGNCKFGHKCALAHVLPGQSMAMDRKNKKAAQAAAAAAAATEKGATVSKDGFKDVSGKSTPRKRDGHHNSPAISHGAVHSGAVASQSGSGRNVTLFTGGSTAPIRILGTPATSTRPPINMPLKSPISPSAPAPPLKDTDFTSFAALEMEGLDMPEQSDQDRADNDSRDRGELEQPVSEAVYSGDEIVLSCKIDSNIPRSGSNPPSPVPLPTSAPRPSVPLTKTDFGPIGSPPSSARLNGALGGRKGPQSHLPSSPFSAPGAQSIFLSSSLNTGEPGSSPGFIGGTAGRDNSGAGAFSMGGIAASLNTGMTLLRGYDDDDFGPSRGRTARGLGGKSSTTEGDDDLEEFIPSSLSDLLTPEEKRRRISRSGQSQAQGAPMLTSRLINAGESLTAGTSMGHRYSRSVPAPSLLGDVKSIWADTTGVNKQRATPNIPETEDTTGLQVPKPALNGGANPIIDELGISMSMGSSSSLTTHINASLSPSNASAAFLPGLHHHYLKAKQQSQLLAVGSGPLATAGRQNSGNSSTKSIRTASGALFPAANTATNSTVGNIGVPTQGGISQTYRATPSPFDLTQHQHQYHNRALGGFGQGGTEDPLNHYISSPSARALQAHAPGQSLPQGLAAGLSRIHALPPLPNLTSPSTSLSTDANYGLTTNAPYEEWKFAPSPVPNMLGGARATLSTAAGDLVGTIINGPNTNVPRMSHSTVTRVGGATTSINPSSPASTRPVISGGPYPPVPETSMPHEDDELFAMDG